MSEQQLGTIVIGGSQAGLAVGYYLKQRGLPFVILDENRRGLLFLYSLSSALVGGVGRDAEHIVDHIVSRRLSKKDDAVARATSAGRQYA